MLRGSKLISPAVVLTGVVLAGFPSLWAQEKYQVDGVHSTLIFKVKHLGVSNFYGRFNSISGNLTLDGADPAKSAVEVQVKAESIDTGNEKRDQHLRGPDFFNVKQFPAISFKSREVKKAGENGYQVSGDLTLHGVTKPLTAQFTRTGTGKNFQGGEIAGFETTFKLKRSDFGMSFMLQGLGDDIEVTLSVECAKK